jgi:hypothetical protein
LRRREQIGNPGVQLSGLETFNCDVASSQQGFSISIVSWEVIFLASWTLRTQPRCRVPVK